MVGHRNHCRKCSWQGLLTTDIPCFASSTSTSQSDFSSQLRETFHELAIVKLFTNRFWQEQLAMDQAERLSWSVLAVSLVGLVFSCGRRRAMASTAAPSGGGNR
jgi:hypothetical protein